MYRISALPWAGTTVPSLRSGSKRRSSSYRAPVEGNSLVIVMLRSELHELSKLKKFGEMLFFARWLCFCEKLEALEEMLQGSVTSSWVSVSQPWPSRRDVIVSPAERGRTESAEWFVCVALGWKVEVLLRKVPCLRSAARVSFEY